MGGTVLVVEDDADIVELLELYLTGGGYDVISANDGVEALELLRERTADVALVDIMMPRMNGYDFIRELRRTSSMPVLVVSARTQTADKIVGLDAGADAFIAKPFDPLEVAAHIRAVLRRAGATRPEPVAPPAAAGDSVIVVGALAFDTERLALTRSGEPVPLTAAELKIMAALMSSPGRVFSKEQLYACVSGDPVALGGSGVASSVMMHVSNIRAKLEDDPLSPRFIKTIRGLGYALDGS